MFIRKLTTLRLIRDDFDTYLIPTIAVRWHQATKDIHSLNISLLWFKWSLEFDTVTKLGKKDPNFMENQLKKAAAFQDHHSWIR
jgi:hypothetical protein